MPSVKEVSEKKIIPLTKCPSFAVLSHLAEHPLDLTQPGSITPERIATYVAQACGFKLIYAMQKVNEPILHALEKLAEEQHVIEKMHKMQEGEITNFINGFPSENRPVLHTALRDQFDNPQEAPVAKEARLKAKEVWEQVKKFEGETKDFTDLVVIAIGGSELGPKACFEALYNIHNNGKKVHYISNIDPDATTAVFKNLDLKKTLVAVVSKSGTTLETTTNEKRARSYFKKAGINPNDHFIAVTSQGSPMDNRKEYKYVFNLWDWVGGRFSSTSAVGAIPIAFTMGFPVFEDFLRGAHAMDQVALEKDLHTNLPLLLALLGIWNRNFLNHDTLAIIPYSYALRAFTDHLQQVDMESNGKCIDQNGHLTDFETGPIIWGRTGTDAQHSFFQLLHQGTTKVPMEFIGFVESQFGQDEVFEGTTSQQKLIANLLAQTISLATGQGNQNPNKMFPGNTPSTLLIARQLTPFQLGALLSLYENKVAFQGFLWGINSFDQEGVQLGKVLANRIIDRQKDAKGSESFPLGDALLKHLEKI